MYEPRPRRQLRSTKACDYCHRRRIKCRKSEADADRCQNCVDFGLECESSRPLKRGKAAAAGRAGCLAHASSTTPTDSTTEPSTQATHASYGTAAQAPLRASAPPPVPNQQSSASRPSIASLLYSSSDEKKSQELTPAWRAFALATVPIVRQLMSIYFETAYPIFPFFDRQHLERRLSAEEQVHNRGFFCTIMAACALASARVRDGALSSLGNPPPELVAMPPKTFFTAAQDMLPADLLQVQDFDSLRACAILALASVQDVKLDAMRMYICHYFTMLASWGWHDEANWPSGLLPIDLEERRRVYWSTYTLDIFTSLVFDGCAHYQEGQAKVEYPNGSYHGTPNPKPDGWMVGWNFTTDLYRILEYALNRLRTRSSRFNMFAETAAGETASTTRRIEQQVNRLYAAIPYHFKELHPATGDLDRDIYGFQAANIQATLALLRMALLSLESNPDLEKKCSVVSDVLNTFHQVPKAFQRAISTLLVYHIGGIGNILGSVMEAPMSESTYQRVRTLLLSMADLLESIESFFHQRAGAGSRLREQVENIDRYMMSRRQMETTQQALPENSNTRMQEMVPMTTDTHVGIAGELEGNMSQVQIPDELLQQWALTFNNHQSQFPYFGEAP